jgi:BolA protein
MSTIERMAERLAVLSPVHVDIADDSALHAGHAGAKGGGGHYQLTVVSDQFAGKPTLARHRMVYDCLADLMQKEIHALSIKASTPDEFFSTQP